ncbi:MAG: transposase family protein, partial [Oscillospiraceae bacterium]|nr:transposase family protein [Oscillospiraceae bacterium]
MSIETAILENANKEMRKFGGRPSRLNVLDKLIVMLGYYYDYRTMENISFDYGVSKSRISDAVKWVEQTLIKNG